MKRKQKKLKPQVRKRKLDFLLTPPNYQHCRSTAHIRGMRDVLKQRGGRNQVSRIKCSLFPTFLVEKKLQMSRQYSLTPTELVEVELLIRSRKPLQTLQGVYSLAPTQVVEEKLLTMSDKYSLAPTAQVEEKLLIPSKDRPQAA